MKYVPYAYAYSDNQIYIQTQVLPWKYGAVSNYSFSVGCPWAACRASIYIVLFLEAEWRIWASVNYASLSSDNDQSPVRWTVWIAWKMGDVLLSEYLKEYCSDAVRF